MEALAVCLAKPIKHKDGVRLIVREVKLIPYEKCERNKQYITWPSSEIVDVLDEAEATGLSVIKIHSHPYGPRAFSLQDDRSDSSLFPSIQEWCGPDQIHCSLVFTEDFIVGRYYHQATHTFLPVDKIFVIGDRLRLYSSHVTSNIDCAFDELTYAIFKTLKIGVIGCSGTGSWIAELLGRNQTGNIVICEFDILTNPNLTRVLNSKLKNLGLNKASAIAEAIFEMGHGCLVEIVPLPLQSPKSIEALKGCDIIFGCVDSVFARYLLNTMCTYYSIPYFDIGVHIDATPKALVAAAGGYHYIQPGKSSLLTRGVFSSKELADDTYKVFSKTHYERLEKEGYVHGRKAARPAVGGLNSLSSTLCFNDFESLVLDYLFEDEEPVASKVVCKRSGEVFTQQENKYRTDTSLQRKVGLGDDFFIREASLLDDSLKNSTQVLDGVS
jgi:hypothetical protein